METKLVWYWKHTSIKFFPINFLLIYKYKILSNCFSLPSWNYEKWVKTRCTWKHSNQMLLYQYMKSYQRIVRVSEWLGSTAFLRQWTAKQGPCNPYKPCNHIQNIGMSIFPHISQRFERSSHFHNGISHTGKMIHVSLYWISLLIPGPRIEVKIFCNSFTDYITDIKWMG